MFNSEKKVDPLFIQIQKAEKIAVEEMKIKKEQKDNEKIGLVADGMIEAGKVVNRRDEETKKG